MASETDGPEDLVTQHIVQAVPPAEQVLEDRLVSLSEKIALCKVIHKDLKDLHNELVRKSLQDVSLPLQK